LCLLLFRNPQLFLALSSYSQLPIRMKGARKGMAVRAFFIRVKKSCISFFTLYLLTRMPLVLFSAVLPVISHG